MYLRALKIVESVFGNAHFRCAQVLHDLGLLHYKLGRYQEAEQLITQVPSCLFGDRETVSDARVGFGDP
jgi:hypothetical protein